MLTADILIDMNTGDGNGTTLTPTILANGTQFNGSPSWTVDPSPPTGLTIDASRANTPMLDIINVRGVGVFQLHHPTRPIAVDNLHAVTRCLLDMSAAAITKISVGGWITFGPANANPASSQYDMWNCGGLPDGFGGALQLNAGAAPGTASGYGVNLETQPGGVTTHSNYVQVVPGGAYWVTVLWDYTAGAAKASFFDVYGSLSGTITTTFPTGDTVGLITFGQTEASSAGGTSYFENIIIDYTTAVYPLGPFGPSSAAESLPSLGRGTYQQICNGFAR